MIKESYNIMYTSARIFSAFRHLKNLPVNLPLFRSKQCSTPSAESPSSHWSVTNKQLGVQRCDIEKSKNTGPKSSNTRHGLRQSCRLEHFQESKSLQLEMKQDASAVLSGFSRVLPTFCVG